MWKEMAGRAKTGETEGADDGATQSSYACGGGICERKICGRIARDARVPVLICDIGVREYSCYLNNDTNIRHLSPRYMLRHDTVYPSNLSGGGRADMNGREAVRKKEKGRRRVVDA